MLSCCNCLNLSFAWYLVCALLTGSLQNPSSMAAFASYGTAAAIAAQPATEAFATMAAEDVRPDAAFFHKFYAAKAASDGGARQKKRTRLGEDGDSEDREAEIGACPLPALLPRNCRH